MKKKVLLVSGWASDTDVWDEMLEHMDKEGLYEKILWSECLEDKHNRLFSLLEKQKEPVVVMGSSLGGLLALRGVLKYPESCSELILVCSTSRMVKDEHYIGVDPKIISAMKFGLKLNRKGLLTDFAIKLFSDDPSSDKIEKFLKVAEQFSTKQLVQGLDILLNTDLRKDLKKVQAKVLNLHGTKDNIMPIEQSEYIHKHLQGSSLEIVKDSGHNMLYTHAAEVAKRINNFIKNG